MTCTKPPWRLGTGLGAALGAVILLVPPGTAPAQEVTLDPPTVEVGVLTCIVGDSEGGNGRATASLQCEFDRIGDAPSETYVGRLETLVAEGRLEPKAALIWQVRAPSTDMAVGALAGGYQTYVPPGAEVGTDAPDTVLRGGGDDQVSLLPLSEPAAEVMEVAPVIAEFNLETVKA